MERIKGRRRDSKIRHRSPLHHLPTHQSQTMPSLRPPYTPSLTPLTLFKAVEKVPSV